MEPISAVTLRLARHAILKYLAELRLPNDMTAHYSQLADECKTVADVGKLQAQIKAEVGQ
jgi:hypothetical protein